MRERITTLAYVLGGGEGNRLLPLTKDRAKPAVPFAANYRVIDFVLSNLYHSGIRKVLVLTQYESESLHRHIKQGWEPRFGIGGDQFLQTLPANKDQHGQWYAGTADAIYQKRNHMIKEKSTIVNVFGGDHIYLMDVSDMNQFHLEKEADLTISAIPVLRSQAAGAFGVLKVDSDWRLLDFQEKPKDPAPMPGQPDYCLASMGNYSFKPETLMKALNKDATKAPGNKDEAKENPEKISTKDFGYDVIPDMLRNNHVKIFVYDFNRNLVPGAVESERGFWRDVGSLDEFYKANMAMRDTVPPLNLYNSQWTVLTLMSEPQPAKSVGRGAIDSIVASGSIISNSNVERSVLSYGIQVNDNAEIKDSILLGYTDVGSNVVIRNAIIDRGTLEERVVIPSGTEIGVDKEHDRARGFTISDEGITVVHRKDIFK